MPFVSLETVVKRAPLGLRCTDIVREVSVTAGLVVQARPHNATRPRIAALRSPVSGIYGFHSLPGLRDYEWGLRPASDWCTSGGTPEEANFVITIEDQQRDFLPQVLLLCLPREHLVEVPLYSSPTRVTPGGYAVARGEVWNNSANAPARWAVITAMPGGYATVTDARGLFALFMPSPPLADSPVFESVPLPELHWPLTFQVLYQPGAQVEVVEGYPPSTVSIVGQAAAAVFDTPTTSGSDLSRNLRYAQELILQTEGESRLLVDPA